MDECKPLVAGDRELFRRASDGKLSAPGRGLHSFTCRLSSSVLCRIGVHVGVVQGCVYEVSWGIKEYHGVFRVYFVSETAQFELRSGQV